MSFYLGKDPNNKAVMHISKGYRTSNELRDGILEDTVFHSDLPYIQYTAYKATLNPINSTTTDLNYGLSIPETALTAMDSQVFCYLVEHNGEIKLYETYLPQLPYIQYSDTSPLVTVGSLRYTWTNNAFSVVNSARTPTYRLPAIKLSNPSEVTNVWVVILDTGTTHITNTSETVYVGKGRLDVDGTSLATYRYITSVPVNDVDPIVYTPGGDTIQFINFYTDTETSLSIASDSGRTTIRSGSKEIFDSGVARGKIIFDEITTVVHPEVTIAQNGTREREIATGMQDGDLFSFFSILPQGRYSFSFIGLGVFRSNTSIPLYNEDEYAPPYWLLVSAFSNSIVCTGDGRLLYRTTLQSSNSVVITTLQADHYVTHYK